MYDLNIFKQLIVSLYSPKHISSFRSQGIGKTILYVFILTFLSVIPTIVYFSTALVNGINLAQETIQQKLPSFLIENGQLTSSHNETITIHQGGFTIIFDPSGDLSVNDLDSSIDSLALLQNELAVTAGGTIDSFSYSMLSDISLSKDDMLQFVDTIDSLLVIIISIFSIVIYLFASGIKFIGVTILALVGLILKKDNGNTLPYRYIWRMAAYSMTLSTVFFMIMDFLHTVVPFGFVLSWLISVLVLYLALKEIQKEQI
nr:DUF1189 domain-containing protein [Bacillus dakarensis]